MLTAIKDTEEFYGRILENLRQGEVIVLPTDTVYGFAVDGANKKALDKLIALKGRYEKPFSFFMPRKRISEYAFITQPAILDHFIPGPITVILKRKLDTTLPIEGETIGIRIPKVDFVITLLDKYDKPLAVTSANRAGKRTPHSPTAIAREFPMIDVIIDNGELASRPSTVIDLTTTPPAVKRKGAIPILEIESVYGHNIQLDRALKFNVLFVCSGNTCRSPMAGGILRTMVDQDLCEIKSAGTLPMTGLPASENSIKVVSEYGGSIDDHLSQSLNRELIDWADLILVMAHQHYQHIVDIQPDAGIKTFLIRAYKDHEQDSEIDDPVGQDMAAYRKTAVDMLPLLKIIAQDIEQRFPS
jgi:tRNA threonylcarbamoyl adenosine modification protein (Sua5/YciO/YrdC/YwlC family)